MLVCLNSYLFELFFKTPVLLRGVVLPDGAAALLAARGPGRASAAARPTLAPGQGLRSPADGELHSAGGMRDEEATARRVVAHPRGSGSREKSGRLPAKPVEGFQVVAEVGQSSPGGGSSEAGQDVGQALAVPGARSAQCGGIGGGGRSSRSQLEVFRRRLDEVTLILRK